MVKSGVLASGLLLVAGTFARHVLNGTNESAPGCRTVQANQGATGEAQDNLEGLTRLYPRRPKKPKKPSHDTSDKKFRALAGAVTKGGFHKEMTIVGDSYASGIGALDNWGKGACKRNDGSFGKRLFRLLRPARFHNIACSGANVDDIIKHQVHDFDYGAPDLVLMTAGGNNGGTFRNVIRSCVVYPSTNECDIALDKARKWAGTLPTALGDLYIEMKAITPDFSGRDREIIHLSYVELYNEHSPKTACPVHTLKWMGFGGDLPSMRKFDFRRDVNEVIRALNTQIRRTAKLYGITYLDVNKYFDGHRYCDGPDPWIQTDVHRRLEDGVLAHPTFEGHGAYVQAVMEHLNRTKPGTTPPPLSIPESLSARLGEFSIVSTVGVVAETPSPRWSLPPSLSAQLGHFSIVSTIGVVPTGARIETMQTLSTVLVQPAGPQTLTVATPAS